MRGESVGWFKPFLIWFSIAAGLMLFDRLGVIKPLRLVLEVPIAPVRVGFGGLGKSFTGWGGKFSDVRLSTTRIADLERHVAELEVEANRAKELEKENEAFRILTSANVVEQAKVVPARIVGRGARWLLNSGTGSGVVEGAAVISPEGVFVGRVVDVGDFVSTMERKDDGRFLLPAVTSGNVEGNVTGGDKLRMSEVLQANPLALGELVSTQGSASVPAGLLVGKVVEIEERPVEVYKAAVLDSLVDWEKLEYVFIITK